MTTNTFARRAGLGLAIALSLTLPAAAGDWNNGAGGIKDYGGVGGVPVPAPVPVPEYAAQWYFRGDLGIGFGANPATSRTGQPFGVTDSPGTVGPQPFGYGGANFTSFSDEREFSPSYMFGAGVGRYVTDRFRLDLTGEYRGDFDSTQAGRIDTPAIRSIRRHAAHIARMRMFRSMARSQTKHASALACFC